MLRSFKVAVLTLLCAVCCSAQTVPQVFGQVLDPTGTAVAGAEVAVGGVLQTRTDPAGRFTLSLTSPSTLVTVSFHGLQATAQVSPGANLTVVLKPSTQQSATVTATRSSVDFGLNTSPAATLDERDLTQYPALTLDERLRQHAGFELFRRSSSWVANPTTEGVSLRGLGSTAASRTLVLADLVPLNDGFGGWVHWNEIPPEAIDAVTLAGGGGSDLYGSSALGGVIDVIPSRPGPVLAQADLAAASESTSSYSGRADLQEARTDARQSRWSELAAAQSFRTAGYTVVAPAVRGPVDIPSNVHFQTGRLEINRTFPEQNRLSLTGNLLNEAHGNGTPIQTNGTRLWRYVLGDDWTANPHAGGRVRALGSDEAYRQSFSAINAARSSEQLSRLQRVGTQEFGASADASIHFTHLAFVTGGDLRDLRATDFETPYAAGSPSGLQDTTARQRFFGGFGELLAERGRWSGTISLRADEAANLATDTIARTGTKPPTSTPTPTATNSSSTLASASSGSFRPMSPSTPPPSAPFAPRP